MKNKTILIVDDNEINRSMLSDMLSEDYNIIEAPNGQTALDILTHKGSEICLMLLDIVMPEMDGFEVLALMNKAGWIDVIPVVIISSENSAAYIDHAYDLGATDYINRPFDQKTVLRRVENTIMLYSKQKKLETMVAEQIFEKEKSNFVMVEILSNIVEFRNGESGLHVLHIRVFTEILLRQLQKITDKYRLSTAKMALVVNASALHDVGKISIPEEILNKPGKLTPEEFEIIKTHSAIGANIMEDALKRHDSELVKIARDICRWHHERYDGRGYPDGLVGDEIPIEAQVVAMADVYDALTSVRVYKAAYTHERAVEMILAGECGVFNPILLTCLQKVAPTLKDELKVNSAAGIEEKEIRSISGQIISSGKVSSRTLNLLEQERIKYQFFASISNETHFEYTIDTDLLMFSEYTDILPDLPIAIEHPRESAKLHEVLAKEDHERLYRLFEATTPENPIVKSEYTLNIGGEKKKYKLFARTIWGVDDSSDKEKIISLIGKIVPDDSAAV